MTAANHVRGNERFSHRGGFTLIELLVVIAIISLLATILLPSLSEAQKMAKDVTCKSNMRGTHVAIVLYAQDNNDWGPLAATGNWGLPFWEQYLMPYAGEATGLFKCPVKHFEYENSWKSKWTEQWFINLYGHLGECVGGRSYVANGNFMCAPGSGWFPNVKQLSDTGIPTETFLFFDAASAFQATIYWSNYKAQDQTYEAYTYVHDDGLNVVYLDGRIGWRSRQDVYTANGPGLWR